MASLEESFDEVTQSETESVVLIRPEDMQLGKNSGLGMITVGVGMIISFGIAWIISILRRS